MSPESRALPGSTGISGGDFSPPAGVAATKLSESAAAPSIGQGKADAKSRWVAVRWEDTELQADLTMGNLASALTLQSDEAALIAELRCCPGVRGKWDIGKNPMSRTLYCLRHRDTTKVFPITSGLFSAGGCVGRPAAIWSRFAPIPSEFGRGFSSKFPNSRGFPFQMRPAFDETRLSGDNRKVASRNMWACGAAGSALPWHGRGHRFDPDQVHQYPLQNHLIRYLYLYRV